MPVFCLLVHNNIILYKLRGLGGEGGGGEEGGYNLHGGGRNLKFQSGTSKFNVRSGNSVTLTVSVCKYSF